jgi:hypothetical protein
MVIPVLIADIIPHVPPLIADILLYVTAVISNILFHFTAVIANIAPGIGLPGGRCKMLWVHRTTRSRTTAGHACTTSPAAATSSQHKVVPKHGQRSHQHC